MVENRKIAIKIGANKINADIYRTKEAIQLFSSLAIKEEEKYLCSKYFPVHTSVLDLACGTGRTTKWLHEQGYYVKGIDLSDEMINAARYQHPNISFTEGNYTDIKEPDESFDNVLISFNGLDYAFPDNAREKAISECARILTTNNRGGYFIFSSHNIKSLHGSIFYWNHYKRFLLSNMIRAFYQWEYIFEPHSGLWTYYGSPNKIIKDVERFGFEFCEMVSYRYPLKFMRNKMLNTYLAPYIHYVFHKK
jgi:SAM-dependent methyltransferase